jgi:hypothetical protein
LRKIFPVLEIARDLKVWEIIAEDPKDKDRERRHG